jgi:hypothetical protein
VQVVVTNVSTSRLKSAQALIVLRLTDEGWMRAGCGDALSVQPDTPSGCELEGAAQVELAPGRSVDERSSLPYILDWPSGNSPEPGAFAVVVAFGDDVYASGAAARLDVLAP